MSIFFWLFHLLTRFRRRYYASISSGTAITAQTAISRIIFWKIMMLRVGLTGGIGSGKTTVAALFQELGVPIIDSDLIAKQVTEIGQPAYRAIIDKLGEEILTPDNHLNRQKLKEIIFSSNEKKQWLEDLLHPLIKNQIQKEAQRSHFSYCMVAIPLLVETKSYDLIDRVLVVDSTVEDQIERTLKRDQLDKNTLVKIINSQASREERLAVADDVIHNLTDFENLRKEVTALHHYYLSIS